MNVSSRNFDLFYLALRWSLIAVVWLAVVVGGIASILYNGAYADWVREQLGCVIHSIGWAFSLALLMPRAGAFRLTWVALAISCLLECLQLWHPHFLEVLRTQPLGRLALGSAFRWTDFAYYAIGALVGFGLLSMLPFRERREVGAPS